MCYSVYIHMYVYVLNLLPGLYQVHNSKVPLPTGTARGHWLPLTQDYAYTYVPTCMLHVAKPQLDTWKTTLVRITGKMKVAACVSCTQ